MKTRLAIALIALAGPAAAQSTWTAEGITVQRSPPSVLEGERRQFDEYRTNAIGRQDPLMLDYWQRRLDLAIAHDSGRLSPEAYAQARKVHDDLFVMRLQSEIQRRGSQAEADAQRAANEAQARAEAQRRQSALDLGLQLLMPPTPAPTVNCITQRAGGAVFTNCR